MFDDRYYTNKPADLREEAKTIGLQHFDEEVAKAIKEVVNVYGIKENTYTEYDKQPEMDPLFIRLECLLKAVEYYTDVDTTIMRMSGIMESVYCKNLIF